jgi:tRNA A37 threonylcarbamoyladenosine dehydratase
MEGLSIHGTTTEPITEAYRLHRRFDRFARLTGDEGMERLMNSFVIVFGLGGVGSYAAEALCRSGIGKIRIVDFDDVCVTNTNRQLHALKGNIGKPKSSLMGDRLRLINPMAEIDDRQLFYQAETSEELLEGRPDFVIDAIDQFTAKCHLLASCKARGIPVVSSMGAAGRMDPTRIQVTDLNRTHHDKMALNVRQILREKHGFPRGRAKWGIQSVFSDEEMILPKPLGYESETGFRCVCPKGQNGLLSCDRRARIDGSASFVTGTFGMVTASTAIKGLLAQGQSEGGDT